MNEMIVKRNELLAQKVIKGLQSRNMSGYYAANREEALKIALELIPEGSSAIMGGSVSAAEIGLVKALKEGNYNFIDRNELPTSALPCWLPMTRISSSPAAMPSRMMASWSILTATQTVSLRLPRGPKM